MNKLTNAGPDRARGNEPVRATGPRQRAAAAFLAVGLMLTASVVAMPKAEAAPAMCHGCICTTDTVGQLRDCFGVSACQAPAYGVHAAGKSLCTTVTTCSSGVYGARVNGVGYCTPLPTVTYCGTGYVGARVNGQGACQPTPTVTPCGSGTYGVRLNGNGICQSPPRVTTCPQGSVGARVDGLGACQSLPPFCDEGFGYGVKPYCLNAVYEIVNPLVSDVVDLLDENPAELVQEVARLASGLKSALCPGASLSDLDFFDTVVVSFDGGPDPELARRPSLAGSIKYWTPEQYECLFPKQANSPRNGVVPKPGTWANSPEFASATAGMTPQQKAGFLLPDPGDWNRLINYEGDPAAPPEANVMAQASSASDDWDCVYLTPAPSAPRPHVESCSTGYVALRVLLPANQEDSPINGCHYDELQGAVEALESQFRVYGPGHSKGDLDIRVFCYVKSSTIPAWDACFDPSTWRRSCTSDSQDLLSRLEWHVRNRAYYVNETGHAVYWMVNDAWDLVTTIDYYASNFGIGSFPGQVSLLAENSWGGFDTPHMTAWMVHELGHNFNAGHYPDNSWRKHVCNSGWWTDPVVYYASVMNYCYAGGHGYTGFDDGNYNAVYRRMYGL